jgi:hypothetical protein
MLDYKSYLTYQDYKELGGTLDESTFSLYERQAQRYLDSFTFNRCQQLDVIPNEVREVLVEFIKQMNSMDNQKKEGDTVTQYSNGVESFTYSLKTETEVKKELQEIALSWLPDYLTTRWVYFDVREYLQSKSNDTE